MVRRCANNSSEFFSNLKAFSVVDSNHATHSVQTLFCDSVFMRCRNLTARHGAGSRLIGTPAEHRFSPDSGGAGEKDYEKFSEITEPDETLVVYVLKGVG